MYAKIKDEIRQEYYAQNFPNDGQRFVAWYLRNIHLRDMNQAKAEITDGAEDKQIDAIFVDDDNSTVYVISVGCPPMPRSRAGQGEPKSVATGASNAQW